MTSRYAVKLDRWFSSVSFRLFVSCCSFVNLAHSTKRSIHMLLYFISLLKVYAAELNREEGQGMAEYALIIALVAVVLVAALGLLSGGIEGAFNAIVGELPEAAP
jgi:pilus assembly protein Flp/PilA